MRRRYFNNKLMNNKIIIYTSADNLIVIPSNYDFGANVITNIINNNNIGKITFDGNVTEIGDRAFYNCSSLTSITIPDSVTSVGGNAFESCSLTSVTIPDSVTEIGYDAFKDCHSLTSVTIPDSVTEIGGAAFQNCTSLTSISIPDSVTSIGYSAFENCTSLTSVYCKAVTPPVLGNVYVFDDNTSVRKIYVPTGSVDTYKSTTRWSEYADAIEGYNF